METKKGSNDYKPMNYVKRSPVTFTKNSEADEKGSSKANFPIRKFTPIELQKRRE